MDSKYALVYEPSHEKPHLAVALKTPSLDSTAESPLLIEEYHEVQCQNCKSIYNLPNGAFTYRCKSCNHFNNMNPNQNITTMFRYCLIL